MSGSRLQAFVCALGTAVSLMLADSVGAATLHCGAGDVQCLVAAINEANARPQHKTTIRLAGGTYALSDVDNLTNGANGLPSIASTITIEADTTDTTLTRAAGALRFRFLHVESAGRLTLNGLALVGGQTSSVTDSPMSPNGGAILNDGGMVTIVNGRFENNEADEGGAIYTDLGALTISDSTFFNNTSEDAAVVNAGGIMKLRRSQFSQNHAQFGSGAVWSQDGEADISQSRFVGNSSIGAGALFISRGTASIRKTTFSGNSGEGATALSVQAQASVVVLDSAFVDNLHSSSVIANIGTLDVTNTTFARNGFSSFGGRVVSNSGQLTLRNSTIAGNGPGNGAGTGNIVSSPAATTILQNTIVVHNSDDPFMTDCSGGGFTSLGNNLIGDPSSCNPLLQPTDLIGDAGLGELADDGTPGNAHVVLLPESRAINAADSSACPTKDQIGQRRLPRCDIGAVEFRKSKPQVVTPSADGSRVPPEPVVFDSDLTAWSLGPNQEILRNGAQAAGGYGSQILWYQGAIYVLGDDSFWWQWTGSTWAFAGPSDPSL